MTSAKPASALDFTGRRILVTGGAQGIGKGIVQKFLDLNGTVVALDRNAEGLAKLKSEYPAVETVGVDLRDWAATEKAVESVLPIHHLANNAGVFRTLSLLEIDEEFFNSIVDVNFKGALHVAQIVAKGMIAHNIKDGTIVNTSSIGDNLAHPLVSVYSATKAAIAMLTKTMAVELAPHGIRVNTIRPGTIKTDLAMGLSPEEFDKTVGASLRRQLVHEMIDVEDVANPVAYLSSPLSSSITGTSITVDHGFGIHA